MATRTTLAAAGLAVMCALMALASCGGGSPAPIVADGAGTGTDGAQSGPARIRLALAPDPVWQWLEDSGEAQRWQAQNNIRIEVSHPFDQFSAFAGGHTDVVVINALDVPQFMEQSDREPVIVGKLTTDHSFLGVRRTSRAETLNDLVETQIAVDGTLGSTLLWGLIADSMHGLDFRDVGTVDFDLVVVEPASAADLVMRGDVDACVCVPEFSASELASGRLRPLYGGLSGAEVYAQEVRGDPRALPVASAFVVEKEWYSRHRAAVASLLELWDWALQHWSSQPKDFLVANYPHLFSVETDAEIAWMTEYVDDHDWITASVHLTEQDSALHADIFAEMQRLGFVSDDITAPEMDSSYSSASGG